MKYKCKDCGAEYDEKIEYCGCGNNTFEILDAPVIEPKFQKSKNIEQGEIISWVFFALCIFLSLIILFVIPNSVKIVSEEVIEFTQPQKEIPDIEKIWKSSSKSVKKPTVQEVAEDPIVIVQKIIRRIEEPAPVRQNLQNPAPAPQNNQNTRSVEKPKPVDPVKSAESVQNPKSEQLQDTVKVEKPANQTPASNVNDPQLNLYKNILRETLLSKLIVGSVNGAGTCIVSFSIDSSGKLQDRKFVQYSDNKTVNDAVYYMMMSLPVFQPPPASYHGEIIRLKFYINNGSYEISFV